MVADYAHWWQELVEMLRKFMMTGVLMFVDSGTFEQILVGVGFSIVFMTLQFKYQPFEDDIDDNLATTGGFSTTATLLLAVLLKAKVGTGLTGVLIIVVNLMVLVCALYQIFFDVIPEMIEKTQQKYDRAMWALEQAKRKYTGEDNDKMIVEENPTVELKEDLAPLPPQPAKSNGPVEPAAADGNDEELRATQLKYFNRYDLDGSKTINSSEELLQLCTNLTVKLNLKVRLAELQQLVEEAGDMEENEWDFEEFKEWFDTTLLNH